MHSGNVEVYCGKLGGIWFCIGMLEEKLRFTYFSKRSRNLTLTRGLKHLKATEKWKLKKPTEKIWKKIRILYQAYKGFEVNFNFNLCWEKITPFNRKVLELTQHIPKGYVATYGGLARVLDISKASRAVGRALALNPFPLAVPCHRVVKSDLSLGGCSLGLKVKAEILKHEGVKIGRINGIFRVKPEFLVDLREILKS
jgi:methylated-DNA-[protein]-cysteine S-methyltransferase